MGYYVSFRDGNDTNNLSGSMTDFFVRDRKVSALEVLITNPADRAGENYLKLKPVLEKKFFGQEFPEDNVHIQIIHNILDIQKLLGIYVNDIIYAVNNLREVQDIEETPDIFGLANPLNQTNINITIGKLQKELSATTQRFKQENIRLELAPLQKEVSKKDLEDYDKLAAAEANNKTVIQSGNPCPRYRGSCNGK